MALAEVGGGTQRATTGDNNAVDSAALAFPAAVASGNLLIVAGAWWGTTAAPTSITVTDTRSTSYTVILGTVGAGMTWRTFIAWGVAASSGACTVTVNPAGADATHAGSYSIDEFSGQHASPASVDGGTTTGQTAATISDTITTATVNELLIAAASHDGASNAFTVSGGGTAIGQNITNANNQMHAAQFRLVTTATAYTLSWAVTGSATAGAVQSYSFKEAAAVVGGSRPLPFVVTQALHRAGGW